MTWTWQLQRADGSTTEVAGLDESEWSSQADAETWIGENWPTLLESGVEQVVLFEGDRREYGPMSLRPPNNT
jgi:hypothetical protein